MSVYLYLNETWHVDNWVNGGDVPLSYASKYLSDERGETLTPDENLIYNFPVPTESLEPCISLGNSNNIKNISMRNNYYNGSKLPSMRNASRYNEDGLIICCSNTLSNKLAAQLGNKKAVVEITQPQKLRKAIDRQLGIQGTVKACMYTDEHQRNHFLKSTEDKWQDEYRFFWKYDKKELGKDKIVKIPKGIAKLIQYYQPKP